MSVGCLGICSLLVSGVMITFPSKDKMRTWGTHGLKPWGKYSHPYFIQKETSQTQFSDVRVLNFLLQLPLLPCLPVVAPTLLFSSPGETGRHHFVCRPAISLRNADQHKMSKRAPSCPLGVPLTPSTLWVQKAPDSIHGSKICFLRIPERSNNKTGGCLMLATIYV